MYIQYMFTSIENIDCLCGVRRVNICMEFLGSTSTCISNQTHSNSGAMFSWGGGCLYKVNNTASQTGSQSQSDRKQQEAFYGLGRQG